MIQGSINVSGKEDSTNIKLIGTQGYQSTRGDLLRSVPNIKTDVKINLQEYNDHSG